MHAHIINTLKRPEEVVLTVTKMFNGFDTKSNMKI